MSDKWPRRLIPQDMHYIVHRVASGCIRDKTLILLYEHEDGSTYYGPICARLGGGRLIVNRFLEEWGIARLDEIRYVVAYHWGAFPQGVAQRLLKSDGDLEALIGRVVETRAHEKTTDDALGVIVSRWRKKTPKSPKGQPDNSQSTPGSSSRPNESGLTSEPPSSGNRSVHPLRRLTDEILTYLRELDGRDWTPEQRRFLENAERLEGRPLTEPEKRIWVAQARMIGDL